MFTLMTLVVLSQVNPSLTPAAALDTVPEVEVAEPVVEAAPAKSTSWLIVTPLVTGVGFGLAGRRVALELTRDRDSLPFTMGGGPAGPQLVGALAGAAIGVGLGLVAGYFASEGSTVGKVLSSVLMGLSGYASLTEVASLGWEGFIWVGEAVLGSLGRSFGAF